MFEGFLDMMLVFSGKFLREEKVENIKVKVGEVMFFGYIVI